jgi:ABC-type sugar transport system substrate-binding protein
MQTYIAAFLIAFGLAGSPVNAANTGSHGKRIAFLATAIHFPYVSTLAKALTEASASYGTEVTVLSNSFDPALQSQQMDDAIARKFDMVILMAASEQAIVPALNRAYHAGMPVIAVVGAPKPGTERLYTSFVGDDQPELGRIAARSLMKAIKERGSDGGRIVAITGSLHEGVAPLRLDAFKETIKDNPKIDLAAVEDVAWDTAKSEQAAGQLIARFAPQGGLVGIYGMADNQSVAIVQAVKAAGLTPEKDIIVVSSNCTKEGQRWSRLSEQNFRVDKWSVCLG